jgi:hypothetical protein
VRCPFALLSSTFGAFFAQRGYSFQPRVKGALGTGIKQQCPLNEDFKHPEYLIQNLLYYPSQRMGILYWNKIIERVKK